VFITVLTSFVNSIFCLLNRQNKIDFYDLILLLLLFFQIYWLYKGNEYASIIVAFSIHFFLLKTISTDRLKAILYIAFVLYISQIIFAIYCFIFNGSTELEGTLQNTGVFAIYCVIFIPLCQYLM